MASQPFLMLMLFSLLIFISVLNLSTLAKGDQNAATTSNFVYDTCNKTHGLKNLCISEISSDPRDDLKSSLTGFLMIFVNHSISNFNSNVLFLQTEINSGKFSGNTKNVLEACLNNFQIGTGALRETLQILQTKKGIDVNQLPVTNVVNIVGGCVDEFDGVPVPPEWQSRYSASYALLDLSLSIIDLITS